MNQQPPLATFRPFSQQPPQLNSSQPPIHNNHIYEHSKIKANDNLYNPLRNVIANPQQINRHETAHFTQHAVQSSHLTHQNKHLTSNQYEQIKQHTYMVNQPLQPTTNLDRVQGKHFYILDAQQKYGNPINQQQMRSRIQGNNKQNKYVVYQPQGSNIKEGNYTKINQINQSNSNIGNNNKSNKKLVRSQSKYNCYSCLDQPYERVKNTGCTSFKCPANQCIASQKKYSWFS